MEWHLLSNRVSSRQQDVYDTQLNVYFFFLCGLFPLPPLKPPFCPFTAPFLAAATRFDH